MIKTQLRCEICEEQRVSQEERPHRLDDTSLWIGTKRALYRAGVETLEELAAGKADVHAIRGLGARRRADLIDVLGAHGLSLPKPEYNEFPDPTEEFEAYLERRWPYHRLIYLHRVKPKVPQLTLENLGFLLQLSRQRVHQMEEQITLWKSAYDARNKDNKSRNS